MNDFNDPRSNAAFTNAGQDTQSNTNPFTGDLKGEFSSDFGTSTNAVSQIFKGGGFNAENRTKYIALGAIVILGLAIAAYLLTEPSQDPFEDEFADELAGDTLPDDALDMQGQQGDLAQEEAMGQGQEMGEEGQMSDEQMMAEEGAMADAASQTAPASTGQFTLVSPADGGRRSYDETTTPAEFTWEGPADRINFSRSPSMQTLIKSVPLNGATYYALENPYPGTWYWQVVNSSGASEVRSFTINAPERRSFPVSQPAEGGTIAAQGGVIAWQAGEKIARYTVEMVASGSSFAQPAHRFGTSGTSVAIQGVTPGAYDIRVGAFSEVSGRWEWQYIKNVSVQ